jgi:hypothetical protein
VIVLVFVVFKERKWALDYAYFSLVLIEVKDKKTFIFHI